MGDLEDIVQATAADIESDWVRSLMAQQIPPEALERERPRLKEEALAIAKKYAPAIHGGLTVGCLLIERALRELPAEVRAKLEPIFDPKEPVRDWALNCLNAIFQSNLTSSKHHATDDARSRMAYAVGAVVRSMELEKPGGPVGPSVALHARVMERLRGGEEQLFSQFARLPGDAKSAVLGGYSEGLSWSEADSNAKLGEYAQFYWAVLTDVREVEALPSRTALRDWLVRRLGEQTVREQKRVDRFCAKIGLKFKGRGRPKKNTQS